MHYYQFLVHWLKAWQNPRIYSALQLCCRDWASLVAQTINNLPAMQETQVLSLGREDTLENRMTTHSSILAWKIPWTEEPGKL